MTKEEYKIKCTGHTYVTLEYGEKFLFCLDNDMLYAEDIIIDIERRTGMKFEDIRIEGKKEDFKGLVFFNGGRKRDFWKEFPTEEELKRYIKLKNGR